MAERACPLPATAKPLVEVLDSRRSSGVLVAMSGGVDSCTLAYVAKTVLGERARAVTLDAESSAREELDAARGFASEHGIPHRVVAHSELSDPAYVRNDAMRCYHCRKGMAARLSELAPELGVERIAMGVVTDDYGEHRPGLKAATEAGIWFPYVEANMSKADVRALASDLGLNVADRPSNACLSSRIQYGLEVTGQRLRQVEQAERLVRALAGVRQVRVRHHDDIARIEVHPDDRTSVIEHADEITDAVRELGFTFVSMDLLGYRSGSMNAALSNDASRTEPQP